MYGFYLLINLFCTRLKKFLGAFLFGNSTLLNDASIFGSFRFEMTWYMVTDNPILQVEGLISTNKFQWNKHLQKLSF